MLIVVDAIEVESLHTFYVFFFFFFCLYVSAPPCFDFGLPGVLGIAFGGFLIGVLLVGALWFIKIKTGEVRILCKISKLTHLRPQMITLLIFSFSPPSPPPGSPTGLDISSAAANLSGENAISSLPSTCYIFFLFPSLFLQLLFLITFPSRFSRLPLLGSQATTRFQQPRPL